MDILSVLRSWIPTGTYVYDVQVTLADGQVYTVLGPNTYRLLPDVTTNK